MSKSLGEENVVERNSLLRSLNEQLDALALLDLRERVLRILELDLASDELLDGNAAAGNEIDGGLVVAGAVTERALDVQLFGAHGHDREVDVWLAHATLCN